MNPGCDSLKSRCPAARLAALYADQTSLPNEVCPFKILSINRVHEVSGHVLASVLGRNESSYDRNECAAASRTSGWPCPHTPERIAPDEITFLLYLVSLFSESLGMVQARRVPAITASSHHAGGKGVSFC